MGEEIKTNSAEVLLEDVHESHTFKLHKTEIEIHNIYELADALEIMSDESYGHHVNANKNDFAGWVNEVIKDQGLSLALEHARDRTAAMNIVRKKIKSAGKYGGKERIWLNGHDYRFTIGLLAGLMIGAAATFIILRFLL